jgi:hypothetical protein
MDRRALTLALAASLVLSCRRDPPPTPSVYLAVGASGELFEEVGGPASCDGRKATPVGPLKCSTETSCDAVATGIVGVPCMGETMLVAIEQPAKLDVKQLSKWNDLYAFQVTATDAAGRDLAIGDGAHIHWKFSGALALHDNPGCSDTVPLCAPRSFGYATQAGAGDGTVTATFGLASASKTFPIP